MWKRGSYRENRMATPIFPGLFIAKLPEWIQFLNTGGHPLLRLPDSEIPSFLPTIHSVFLPVCVPLLGFLHISMGSSSHSRRFSQGSDFYTAHLNSSAYAARPLQPPRWCWDAHSIKVYENRCEIISWDSWQEIHGIFIGVVLEKKGLMSSVVSASDVKPTLLGKAVLNSTRLGLYTSCNKSRTLFGAK